MANKEKVVPGCGNCNSYTRVCDVMFQKDELMPTLARRTLIVSPGAIEGPPAEVYGLVCTASNNPESQKNCDYFKARTEEDNLKDTNI